MRARRMYSLARKIATCLLAIGLAMLYARSHFYRDPGSAFFDQERANEQRYSIHRRSEAQEVINDYLNNANASEETVKVGHAPTLALSVISVKRQHTSYLETTIASLLHGLTPEERADLHLSIFIAESDPERHPDWHSEWLSAAVDEISTYALSDIKMDHLRWLEDTDNYSRKGVFDYIQALQKVYDTGAPYVGLFEDDILLADGWLVRTLRGLEDILQDGQDETSWLFMRIFNQDRSTGWKSNQVFSHHEHWIIIGLAVVFILPMALARWKWRSVRQHVDWETIGVIVLIFNPAMVILFFQCGKASMLPPQPGAAAEGFGCCSQAMVFPREQIPGLISYLKWMKRGQVDLILKHHAKEEGLLRYNLYPVQAQHIGIDSARNTEKSEAAAIWSMRFEDMDAGTLQEEHRQMVLDYYGPAESEP